MFLKGFAAIFAAAIAPGTVLYLCGKHFAINWLFYVGMGIFVIGEALLVFLYGIMIEMDKSSSRDLPTTRLAFQPRPLLSFSLLFIGGAWFAWTFA